MPTGLAFKDGALYVIAVDKLIRYDNAEANLANLGSGKVVYDDMPSYAAHGWKYIAVDKDGWFYIPFGPPLDVYKRQVKNAGGSPNISDRTRRCVG